MQIKMHSCPCCVIKTYSAAEMILCLLRSPHGQHQSLKISVLTMYMRNIS